MTNSKMRKVVGPRLMVAFMVSVALLYSLHQQWLVAVSDTESRNKRDAGTGDNEVADGGLEGQGEMSLLDDRFNSEAGERSLENIVDDGDDDALMAKWEEGRQSAAQFSLPENAVGVDDLELGKVLGQDYGQSDGNSFDEDGHNVGVLAAAGEEESQREADPSLTQHGRDYLDVVEGQGQGDNIDGQIDGNSFDEDGHNVGVLAAAGEEESQREADSSLTEHGRDYLDVIEGQGQGDNIDGQIDGNSFDEDGHNVGVLTEAGEEESQREADSSLTEHGRDYLDVVEDQGQGDDSDGKSDKKSIGDAEEENEGKGDETSVENISYVTLGESENIRDDNSDDTDEEKGMMLDEEREKVNDFMRNVVGNDVDKDIGIQDMDNTDNVITGSNHGNNAVRGLDDNIGDDNDIPEINDINGNENNVLVDRMDGVLRKEFLGVSLGDHNAPSSTIEDINDLGNREGGDVSLKGGRETDMGAIGNREGGDVLLEGGRETGMTAIGNREGGDVLLEGGRETDMTAIGNREGGEVTLEGGRETGITAIGNREGGEVTLEGYSETDPLSESVPDGVMRGELRTDGGDEGEKTIQQPQMWSKILVESIDHSDPMTDENILFNELNVPIDPAPALIPDEGTAIDRATGYKPSNINGGHIGVISNTRSYVERPEVVDDTIGMSNSYLPVPNVDKLVGQDVKGDILNSRLNSVLNQGQIPSLDTDVPVISSQKYIDDANSDDNSNLAAPHQESQTEFKSPTVFGTDLTNKGNDSINESEPTHTNRDSFDMSDLGSQLLQNTNYKVEGLDKLEENPLDDNQQVRTPESHETADDNVDDTNRNDIDRTNFQSQLLQVDNAGDTFEYSETNVNDNDGQIDSVLDDKDDNTGDTNLIQEVDDKRNDGGKEESNLTFMKEFALSDLDENEVSRGTSQTSDPIAETMNPSTFLRRTLSSDNPEPSQYSNENVGEENGATYASLVDTLLSPEFPLRDLDETQQEGDERHDGGENNENIRYDNYENTRYNNYDDDYEYPSDIPEAKPLVDESKYDALIPDNNIPSKSDIATPLTDEEYNSLNTPPYSHFEKLLPTDSYKQNDNTLVNSDTGQDNLNIFIEGSEVGMGTSRSDDNYYSEQDEERSEAGEITLESSNCPRKVQLSPVSHQVTALVMFPGALADWLRHTIEQLSGEPSDSLYNVMARLKTGDASALFEMPHRSVIHTHTAHNADFDKAILIVTNPLAVEKQHLRFLPFSVEWRRYFLWDHTIISWLSSNVPLLVLTSDDILSYPQLYLTKIASFLNLDDSKVDMTCALMEEPPLLIDDVSKMSSVYSNDRRRLGRSIDAVIDTASKRAPDILHRLFKYKSVLFM